MSSPFEDEHVDCRCPECLARVPNGARRNGPGVPPAVSAELAALKRKWQEQREAEEQAEAGKEQA